MNRPMAELARARQELSTWLYKGVKGSRAHERVAQLVDDHQTAVKDAHAHQLAEQIRQDIDLKAHPGESSYPCEDCAMVRAANLIDPETAP